MRLSSIYTYTLLAIYTHQKLLRPAHPNHLHPHSIQIKHPCEDAENRFYLWAISTIIKWNSVCAELWIFARTTALCTVIHVEVSPLWKRLAIMAELSFHRIDSHLYLIRMKDALGVRCRGGASARSTQSI